MDCRNYNTSLEEFNSLGIKPDSAAAAASVYHSTNKAMDPINYYRATTQDPRTLLPGPHHQPMLPASPATPVTAAAPPSDTHPNAAAAASFLDHSLAAGFGPYSHHHHQQQQQQHPHPHPQPPPFSPHQLDPYTTSSPHHHHNASSTLAPFQESPRHHPHHQHQHHRPDMVDYASSSSPSFHTPPAMPYSHPQQHPQQPAPSFYHPSPASYTSFNAASFDLDQKKRKMMDLSLEVPTAMKKKPKSRKKRPKEPEDPNAPPKPKRKTGLDKPLILSAALSAFVGGDAEMSRPEIVKVLWKYIKDNNLQDPADRRFILCDDKLKTIFDQDRINSFGMNRDLSAHLTKKIIPTTSSPASELPASPSTTTTTTATAAAAAAAAAAPIAGSEPPPPPPPAPLPASAPSVQAPSPPSHSNPLYME